MPISGASIGTVRKGPFPQRGGPDEIRTDRDQKGRRGAPGRGLPFFFAFSRNCHGPPLGGRTRRRMMFARTPRLLLRPGFPEDAPALASRDCRRGDRPQPGDGAVALSHARRRGLSCQPARSGPALAPDLRARRRARRSWSARAASAGARPARSSSATGSRGRSGAAAMRPRPALRWSRSPGRLASPSLEGSHFLDNPASARVLEKLGFEPLGIVAPRMSCARGEEVPARLMRLELKADGLRGRGRRGAGGLELAAPRPSALRTSVPLRQPSLRRRAAGAGRPRSTGGSPAGRT